MNYQEFFNEMISADELALQVAPLTPADRPQVDTDPWVRESREGASVDREIWAPMVKPELDDYAGFAR
jgi:hypothetical protein